jgi:small subunit ribosomal protein S3
MEERKFIKLKKEEFGIKEYIKRYLGKGRISKLDIEYTPVGEKIIISTATPGLVIGRRGEKIEELTGILKTKFKLENPHIEIKEIENPLFDSQNVADDIAMSLEKVGNIKFKVVAYRKLQEIMTRGALGCEIRLSGKLPSERAKSWRFSEGYLKKAGDSTKEVDRSQSTALTKTGIIGIKVAIMRPDAKLYDRVYITEEILKRVRAPTQEKKKSEENVSSSPEDNKDSTTVVEAKDNKPKKPRKPKKEKAEKVEEEKE